MKTYNPSSLEELQDALSKLDEKGKMIAGGTDETIQMHTFHRVPSELLYVKNVPELTQIRDEDDYLYVGAACTHAQVARNQLVLKYATALADGCSDVGSPQIRNLGTIGGNIANGSPAGDGLPIMWLLDPDIIVLSPKGQRIMKMPEFILGPMKTGIAYNECVVGFRIKKRMGNRVTHFKKLGFRKRVTIARIGLAVELSLNEHHVVEDAKIIVGAISITPVECKEAAQALIGTKLEEEASLKAADAVANLMMEITPEKFDRDYKVYSVKGIMADVLAMF